MYPSIDPLSPKNREMTRSEINQIVDRLGIPRTKPIILQVAKFERFKDPLGAIHAYRIVKKHHDCRLVLAGSGVMHDPEGEAVLAERARRRDGIRIFIWCNCRRKPIWKSMRCNGPLQSCSRSP